VLTFGSLFAGIGGFDLGLERAGMRCKWQVEINPYAQAVLKKHWPDVARHDDVTTFPPEGDWSVDVICGGFPCQDISVAGKGAGLSGARSGLWYEFARIIRQIRPQWVIVENVRAFTSRGIDTVLGQMADLGYDAEWHCIPACAVGAPHRRERIWIVAHAVGDGCCDVADAAATDGKGAGKTGQLRDRLDYAAERGQTKTSAYPPPPPTGGSLNPTWVEWLMGFPPGWTALDASETPLSRRSLRSSAARSSTRKVP